MGIATIIGGTSGGGSGSAPGYTSITFASTITPNYASGAKQSVTLTGNTTLAAPINVPTGLGWDLFLIFTQDSTGGRVVTFNSVYVVVPGGSPIAPQSPDITPGAPTMYHFFWTGAIWWQLNSNSPV